MVSLTLVMACVYCVPFDLTRGDRRGFLQLQVYVVTSRLCVSWLVQKHAAAAAAAAGRIATYAHVRCPLSIS